MQSLIFTAYLMGAENLLSSNAKENFKDTKLMLALPLQEISSTSTTFHCVPCKIRIRHFDSIYFLIISFQLKAFALLSTINYPRPRVQFNLLPRITVTFSIHCVYNNIYRLKFYAIATQRRATLADDEKDSVVILRNLGDTIDRLDDQKSPSHLLKCFYKTLKALLLLLLPLALLLKAFAFQHCRCVP